MRKWCSFLWWSYLMTKFCNNLGATDDNEHSFLWGVATAAYQIEGAVNLDGRGKSIWDTFSHMPNKIANNDTGDITCDGYHHVLEDIELIKALGVNAYRFSISWSRILPLGHNDHINQKGIEYYNKIIDLLLLNKIEPVVTLYHWDLPDFLENNYGGLLNCSFFQQDFMQYAKICFDFFGDRVKKWITINEPWTISALGYGLGLFAPGRCSFRGRCSHGNSSTESYVVAHNLLNAHSAVVEMYRQQYKPTQKGKIGITLNHDWAEPYDPLNQWDQLAAQRRREFQLGWFADPLFFGRYPQSMIDLVGDRLPKFTEAESKRLQGSIDFLGINHYSSKYYLYRDQDEKGKCRQSFDNGMDGSSRPGKRKYPKDVDIKRLESEFVMNGGSGWYDDQCIYESKYDMNGDIIGVQAESPWLNVVPWGFYKMLLWIQNRYYAANITSGVVSKSPPIYITENGCDVPNESNLPKKSALQDSFRISYFQQYLLSLERAIQEGVNIQGYFAWSLMDNFEWADGFEKRFGLHYVDFHDPKRPRFPKESALWYRDYIQYKLSMMVSHPKKSFEHELSPSELISCNSDSTDNNNHRCSWIAFLSAAFKNALEYPVHNAFSFDE